MASGSIRERKTKKGNSWQIIVEDGSDPVSGKRNRMYFTFHGTKKQAEKEMNRLILELEGGGNAAKPSAVQVGTWLEEWLEIYCTQCSRTTVRGYRTAIKSQLIPYLGDIPLKQLKNPQIQTWVNTLSTQRKLSPKTIKNVYLNLKKALDQAVTLRMLSYNPCDGTKLPKLVNYKPNIYETDELAELLECAVQTDMYFPLLLEISTGLRRGELLAVTWDNIDFERGVMSVCKNRVIGDDGVIVKLPKSEAGLREIELGDHLLEVMKWEYSRYQHIKEDDPGFHDNGLLIHKKDGDPYHPDSFGKKWKRFQKKTGLDLNRLHDLRHSCATLLLEAGVDWTVVKERMGHADITTLLNVYAHATRKSRKEAAGTMDDIVFHDMKKQA